MRPAPKPVIRTAEWVILALLPLLLAWKWVLLNNRMLTVGHTLSNWDRAACYLQDLLVWSLLFGLLIGPIRRGWRGWSTLAIIICNLVLVIQMIDIRCKYLFLMPLSLEVVHFALTQLSTFKSSIGIFSGKTYWMGAVTSQAALNMVIPLVWVLRWFWRHILTERLSWWQQWWTGIMQKVKWSARASIVPLVLLAVWVPRQAYHLEENYVVAAVIDTVRGRRQFDDALAQKCDQKLRELSIEDLAHGQDPSAAAARGRNVVIIIVETLCYGDSLGEQPYAQNTPFLRELSQIGPIVTPCYAQTASSTKSMYSILTGQYASASLEVLESQQKEIHGLAWLLSKYGYYSVMYSAQYLTFQNVRGQYLSMGFEVLDARELISIARESGYEPYINSYGCDDRALLCGLVDRLPTDRPYLAIFYNQSTHHPYTFPGLLSREGREYDRYRKALGYMDGVFGELIEQFKKRGQFEKTVFVVVGDHGDRFVNGESQGRTCGLTEQEHKVPLIIAVPGADTRKIDIQWARQIDIVPTILDLLGLAPEGLWVQGRSLLDGQEPPPAYLNSWGPCDIAALIEDRTKFVYDLPSQRMWAYDLEVDPQQENPLSVEDWRKAELVSQLEAFNVYNEVRLRKSTLP